MREELVAVGVSFLQHPSVSDVPVVQREAFLRGKGLTSDEIAEVFRRVGPAALVVRSDGGVGGASQQVRLRGPPTPLHRCV